MEFSTNLIIQISYAVIILIFMIFIDYFLGGMLTGFAVTQTGEMGVIIALMITFTLAFGTFVVPLLILRGTIVNPFNILLGIGCLLVGIPLVLFIYQALVMVVDSFLPENTKVIGWLFVMIAIIVTGFLAPIYIMLKEESVIPIQQIGGQA